MPSFESWTGQAFLDVDPHGALIETGSCVLRWQPASLLPEKPEKWVQVGCMLSACFYKEEKICFLRPS